MFYIDFMSVGLDQHKADCICEGEGYAVFQGVFFTHTIWKVWRAFAFNSTYSDNTT